MASSSQDHHLDSSFEVSSTVGSSSSSDQLANNGPLSDLSSLLHQLPIKRGLSKHYQGKSRSFTSLSDVRCMEDLVKAEHPYSKKLKPCKSYVGLVPLSTSSRVISKKLSNSRGRGSCCFLGANRNGTSFLGSRPPISPHRATRPSS